MESVSIMEKLLLAQPFKKSNLQEIITKDERDRFLRTKFYISTKENDVSHTVSYLFARTKLIEVGLVMGFGCSDHEFKTYQTRLGVYK